MSKFTTNTLVECQNGKVIQILGTTKHVGYETLICSDGIARYDRSTPNSDAGRVTGTCHEYTYPDNIQQENFLVPEGATHYRRSFDNNSIIGSHLEPYKNTYYKNDGDVWCFFCEQHNHWERANNQTEMNDTHNYKKQNNGGIFVIADELELQEKNTFLFSSRKELTEDEEYQHFLETKKLEDQMSARKAIFSKDSKAIYMAALQLLTHEEKPFSELKSKVNKATGLDDAWSILSGLVQAGLAKSKEIDFEMSGTIKKNIKYAYFLV